MVLTLDEAQKIDIELARSHVGGSVGQGLDKLYFYVYSTDPMITCNCARKSFDENAKKTAEKRLSQYENVIVTLTGPIRTL